MDLQILQQEVQISMTVHQQWVLITECFCCPNMILKEHYKKNYDCAVNLFIYSKNGE